MDQMTGTDTGSRSWPKGIAAITLFVEDLAAARQFYLKVFGLPVIFEDSNSAVFKFGNTLINLLKISEAGELIEPANVASREAGFACFTINVDDVDAMCTELTTTQTAQWTGPGVYGPPASPIPAVISGRLQSNRRPNLLPGPTHNRGATDLPITPGTEVRTLSQPFNYAFVRSTC